MNETRCDFSLEQLRLPKALEQDGIGPRLRARLLEGAEKLWSRGVVVAPQAAWSVALERALGDAHRQGRLVRGLDAIEATLSRQAHGLSLADARSEVGRGARVSRLLIMSGDGTERFYRQAERLVCNHAPRVLPVRVDTNSERLAGVVPLAAGVVRALLVEHKEAVVRVLLALHAERLGADEPAS